MKKMKLVMVGNGMAGVRTLEELLKITPDDAEFWDSPGTVVSYVKMAAAAVTGTRPDIGDNRKVSM